MSMTYRPRLNKPQIDALKDEIKLMSRLVLSELKTHKAAKFPVSKTQNMYAITIGFTSFSELSNKVVSTSHHPDFNLLNAFDANALIHIYKNLSHRDAHAEPINIGHIENALVEFTNRTSKPSIPEIGLSDLHELINASDYCEHTYTESCGHPTEFKIEKSADFFDKLLQGDHFIVKGKKESRTFTVTEFEDMYTKKKVFKVLDGKWWNVDTVPFCSGQ